MAVYNERAFIRKCVQNILDASLPEGLESELVIVDDCSTDGTFEILQDLEREHPESIRLLRQDRNRGKGAAIRRAISVMRGDIAVFQDADLEYDPNEYSRLLEPILDGHADVVYGSRFALSTRRRALNFHHFLGNQLITFLSNLCTGLTLTDIETSCGRSPSGQTASVWNPRSPPRSPSGTALSTRSPSATTVAPTSRGKRQTGKMGSRPCT